MRRSVTLAAVLAGTLAGGGAVPAEEGDGLYGGVSWGRTDARDGCEQFSRTFPTLACDESSSGWRVFLGYRFASFLGVFGEYTGFGEIDAVAYTSGGAVAASADGGGYGLGLEVRVPVLERFEAFATAGMFRWEVEASSSGGYRAEEDDSEPMFGLGGRFAVSPRFWLGAEWKRYQDVGDRTTTGQDDLDFVSVTFELRQ